MPNAELALRVNTALNKGEAKVTQDQGEGCCSLRSCWATSLWGPPCLICLNPICCALSHVTAWSHISNREMPSIKSIFLLFWHLHDKGKEGLKLSTTVNSHSKDSCCWPLRIAPQRGCDSNLIWRKNFVPRLEFMMNLFCLLFHESNMYIW